MRFAWPATLVLLLASAVAGRAKAEPLSDAKTIVAHALQAMGGADKLTAIQAATWTAKGKFFGYGDGVDYLGSFAAEGVAKGRTRMEFELNGKRQTVIAVLNADRGWIRTDDELVKLDEKTVHTQQQHAYFIELASLKPLARHDDGLTLATLGEATTEETVAWIIQVSRAGSPDVKLFIDKSTHLPSKAEWKDQVMGKVHTFEILLSNYQEIAGVRFAMRIESKVDGRLFQDSDISDFRVVERLDSRLLEMP